MLRVLALVAAAAVGLCACGKQPVAAPTPPAKPAAEPTNTPPVSYAMTNAQPRLPTVKLWLGSQEVVSEVARTPAQIATGMMFRKEMGENEGMIFVFIRPHRTAFYMKNTFIPLTCAFIDPEGQILELHDMKPLDESQIQAETDRIQYVLEMKQGWFQKNGIAVGTIVRSERGSLRETFFPPRRP